MSSCTLMVSGPEKEQQFELKPEGTVIGRSPNCGVTLDHDRISRRHARIYQDPFGRWIIEDLGSLNGIVVCGEQKRLWSALRPLNWIDASSAVWCVWLIHRAKG